MSQVVGFGAHRFWVVISYGDQSWAEVVVTLKSGVCKLGLQSSAKAVMSLGFPRNDSYLFQQV